MKNLIYFILAITLLSVSCTKKDDANVTPPVTKLHSQLSPDSLYIGYWHCDSTYRNGKLDLIDDVNYNYKFKNDSLIITDDNNIGMKNVYDNWKLSGDTTVTISGTKNGVTITNTLTIVSPPANKKLVLCDGYNTNFLTKQ